MSLRANPRRCLLFVPGARPERFAKAIATGVDQVCIDLEDAVAPPDKASAREATFDFLLTTQSDVTEVGVRINNVTSELGVEDLKRLMARAVRPAFIMLPKIESAQDVIAADRLLSGTAIPLIAQLESPKAIFEARSIAKSSNRIQALMFGGFDYAVAARIKPTRDGWFWARAQLAAAAAEAEVGAIDVPYLDIQNATELSAETQYVIGLGYTSKSAIHPAQVATIQNGYLPTRKEAEYAQRVIAAVGSAKDAAIQVDGKLVDRPIELAARRVTELARLGIQQA